MQGKKGLGTHKSHDGKYIQSVSLFPVGNCSAGSQLSCRVIAELSSMQRTAEISFESHEFSVFDTSQKHTAQFNIEQLELLELKSTQSVLISDVNLCISAWNLFNLKLRKAQGVFLACSQAAPSPFAVAYRVRCPVSPGSTGAGFGASSPVCTGTRLSRD